MQLFFNIDLWSNGRERTFIPKLKRWDESPRTSKKDRRFSEALRKTISKTFFQIHVSEGFVEV